MGNKDVLLEQIELGLPLEHAGLLAGYSFEEIALLSEDEDLNYDIKVHEAKLMSKMLTRVDEQSHVNTRAATWSLERKFKEFAPTNNFNVDMPNAPVPVNVVIKGKVEVVDEEADDNQNNRG